MQLKPGKCATYTHDCVRNGTTTVFAAPNTLDDTIFGRCAPRHRDQEFIAVLDGTEEAVPVGKVIHAVMDDGATLKRCIASANVDQRGVCRISPPLSR